MPGRCYAGIVPAPASFSKRRRRISLVPWQSSCAFALLSDPGRPNTARPSYRRIGVVYLLLNRQTPTISHFSGLYHTASTLAVYASCPPLGELRNTRFRLAGLPLPDGYRTRWTAPVCFSFQMFYIIFLSFPFSGFSRRDRRRDGLRPERSSGQYLDHHRTTWRRGQPARLLQGGRVPSECASARELRRDSAREPNTWRFSRVWDKFNNDAPPCPWPR